MIHFRAKISSIHHDFYGKSHVETGLTECGKKLTKPVNTPTITSSEQWHTQYKLAANDFVLGESGWGKLLWAPPAGSVEVMEPTNISLTRQINGTDFRIRSFVF